MKSLLSITRATLDDAATLVDLGARTFRDTYASTTNEWELEEYVASAFTLDKIGKQLREPQSYFFLASADTQLVGYLHLRIVTPPPCVTGPAPIELSRLYLERGVQGRGFGAQLMQFALDEARRLERATMWLGVYDQNTRAIEFYRQSGVGDAGNREFDFGGVIYHDPVMSRTL